MHMASAAIETRNVLAAALLGAIALGGGALAAAAAGGTATPPLPGRGNLPLLATRAPFVPAPNFAAPLQDIKGFTAIGFVQNATVSNSLCTELPASHWGGTATINGLTITIPCNTILQMPAATFRWADLFDRNGITTTLRQPAALALAPSPGADATIGDFRYPTIEMTVVGNIIRDQHLAGMIYISQQSLNTSSGTITRFDYANGVIYVSGQADGGRDIRLQLNDMNGRFSVGQTPDSRFNVDDENPTIRAVTGYPMCVPRTDPTKTDDTHCPQRNRPLAAGGCRNFAATGFALPTGRELAPPTPGQIYCSGFVMGDPATAAHNEPLSTKQAPFEIGDFITYSGTLLHGDGHGPNGTDTISVHTIAANVGIFTEPGTLPVYLAIGAFGVGPEAPLIFNGVPQEPTDRLVLEAFVTDVTSIVDIYLVDLDPVKGEESQRWITPASMTGGFGAPGSNGQFIDGGITTQFTGPMPGRVRIRANRATPLILNSPTRYMRVVARSLCDPANVNGFAPRVHTGETVDLAYVGGKPTVDVACLRRAIAANGLKTGQYLAPVPNFIFPEVVTPGDPTPPNSLWMLGFLVNGEGPGTGPLVPKPW